MAQITLQINANTQKAAASVGLLEKQVVSLADALSKVKVNKDLTQQINAISRVLNAQTKLNNSQTKQNELMLKAGVAADRHTETMRKLDTQMLKNNQDYNLKFNKSQQKWLELENKSIKESNRHSEALKKVDKQQTKNASTTGKHSTAVSKNTKAVEQNTSSIANNIAKFLEWQISATLVMQPLNMLRNAWRSLNETLVETEDAVIEIRRVVGDIPTEEISTKLYNLGIKYGQTFENVSEVAMNFAKSGLSWNDALKAAEAAILAMNVAELDATESSEGLIAVMRQFGYEAKDLEHIIDVLNKTADTAPVTTEKLLQALQKTGSYAKQANLDLNETVALITTLSGATGVSGQQLGTALKSVLAYTTKGKSLDVYAGLSDDMGKIVGEYRKGAASILEVWKQLSHELNNLSAEQADALAEYAESEEGQALESALGEELGEIYDDMTGVYDTAGTYRKNYFIALMKNFDDVDTALANIREVDGYSQKENLQYMDTYTAKVTALKTEWQKLANEEQGFLEFKKDLAEIGLKILQLSEWTGGLRTGFLLLLTAISALAGSKILSTFGSLFASFKNGIALTKNWTKVTELQTLAANAATFADQQRATAVTICNDATATAEAKTAALTAAEEAETVAANAAAAAQQAKAAATNTVIAIIMLSITAISALIGYTEKHKKTVEEDREAIISRWKEEKEEIKDIIEMNSVIDDTTSSEQELTNAEQSLERQLKLTRKEIRENSDSYEDYIGLIKIATEEKIKQAKMDAAAAASAAKYNLYSTDFIPVEEWGNYGLTPADLTEDQKTAYNIAYQDWRKSENETNPFRLYNSLSEAQEALYDNGLYETDLYRAVSENKEEAYKYITEFLSAITDFAVLDELANGGSVDNVDLGDVFSKSNFDTTYVSKIFRDYVKDAIGAWSVKGRGSGSEGGSGGSGGGSSSSGTGSQILEVLKDIRASSSTIADIQEKQKALADAERNRTARIYNAETGRFEARAVAKDVEAARGNLDKALEKAAEEEVYAIIGKDDFTIADVTAALNILSKYGTITGDAAWVSDFSEQITRALSGDAPTSESVSDVLVGATDQSKGAGVYTASSSRSDSHDVTYIINGVNFSREAAETYTFAELCETAAKMK